MSDPRKQKPHIFLESLNERERLFYVEKVNRGNEVLYERLKNTQPVIQRKKLEHDFELHKKLGEYMKRKSRFRLPKMSPSRTGSQSELFDSASYATLHAKAAAESGEDADAAFVLNEGSPIQSMAEFRKNVLSVKRAPNLGKTSPQAMARSQSQGNPKNSENPVKFELTHEPEPVR
jgi:hypothetical protein